MSAQVNLLGGSQVSEWTDRRVDSGSHLWIEWPAINSIRASDIERHQQSCCGISRSCSVQEECSVRGSDPQSGTQASVQCQFCRTNGQRKTWSFCLHIQFTYVSTALPSVSLQMLLPVLKKHRSEHIADQQKRGKLGIK